MVRAINVVVSILLAGFVTLALFFLMQFLIAGGGEAEDEGPRYKIADITMPEMELDIQRQQPKPERLDEVEDLPELPEIEFDVDAPAGEGINIGNVNVNVDIGAGASLAAADAEYLPIVTVPPQYPNRAAQRGIEGWCLVEFTVNANGGVEDARVVDGEPPGIFDRSSLRAVARFRFNPKTRNGEPVSTPGVQYVFRYTLEQ